MSIEHIDQPIQVGGLVFEDRHQAEMALDLIDSTLLEIFMVDTPINKVKPIEFELMHSLTNNFDAASRGATDDAVKWLRSRKGPLKEADVDGFLNVFGKRMDAFPPDVQAKVAKATGAMYDIQRKAFAKTVGITPSFKLIDTASKQWMAKDSMHWIGSFYDDSVSVALRSHVGDTMLTQGLGRTDAAALFQKNLARDIKLGKLPALAGIPPPGWNSTPQAYFEGLTANAASRATTWSALESFREGGVEVYRVEAVMDERTSNICRTMHGKEFAVQWGLDQRDAALTSTSPEAYKKAAGWQRAKDVQAKFGVAPGKAASPAQSRSMAEGGLVFPPYHYRCRTVIISSSSTSFKVTGTKPLSPEPKLTKPVIKPKPTPTLPTLTPTTPRSSAILDDLYTKQIAYIDGQVAARGEQAFSGILDEIITASGGPHGRIASSGWKEGRNLFRTVSDEIKKKLKRWESDINKKMGRLWSNAAAERYKINTIKVTHTRLADASYDTVSKVIKMPSWGKSRTLFHEWGHSLDDINSTIGNEGKRFLFKRSKGEIAQPLHKVSKGYAKSSTMVYQDKFYDPYVGVIYRKGSEVTSMGFEAMMKDPLAFYKKDKEHFSFILSILRGQI